VPSLLRSASLLLLSSWAAGHQYHAAVVTLNWNESSKSIEISARLHSDDLEAELQQRAGRRLEIDRDTEAEKLACAWTMEGLRLRDGAGKAIALQCVGLKPGNHSSDVFLEAQSNAPPATMACSLLLSRLPKQKNQILLRRNEKPLRGALVFTRQTAEWQPLPWAASPAPRPQSARP
jgi:hypothetical protein